MEEMPDSYKLSNKISLEECKTVEQRIKEENSYNGHHMLEKTAEKLFEQSINEGCCIARCNEELIGCLLMMGVENDGLKLFEWGSLLVKPPYRGQGIGYKLIKNILEVYQDFPIYSVTNVPAVIKMNENLEQYKYIKATIPGKILKIIESPGALLKNDIVYSNNILHALIQKHAQFSSKTY